MYSKISKVNIKTLRTLRLGGSIFCKNRYGLLILKNLLFPLPENGFNLELMVEFLPLGGMTERLKVTVLKTVVVKATVGSNPTPSAKVVRHPNMGRCQSG